MPSTSHIFDYLMVAGGLVLVPLILLRACIVLKKGEIDRRHPRLPFTRTGDPWSFWSILIWSLIGAAIIGWGTAHHIGRLLRFR